MVTRVVLVGAGGFGRETLDVIHAINSEDSTKIELVGVVDDSPQSKHLELLSKQGVSFLGNVRCLPEILPDVSFVVGVGKPDTRERIASYLSRSGMSTVSLIHPKSVIGSLSSIGPGSIICAGAQVSTNVILGNHVHINPGAIVGHDVEVADFASVNPGAVISGNVAIGHSSMIGAGAVILQGLSVGARSVVGAGAVVVRDVSPNCIVKGVPAR